tara:strand:- start:130 stop:246 length:117 start_codon:yes stop_codon:yes gene_type:complete
MFFISFTLHLHGLVTVILLAALREQFILMLRRGDKLSV